MDVFVEQMVKRRMTGKDLFLVFACLILAVLIFIFSVFFMPIVLGELAFLGAIVGVGVIYAAYFLITNMNVEYEYIITNGEIDIDKIIGKRKRKRLVTANIRTFEDFGLYKQEEHSGNNYTNRIFSTESTYSENYYAVFTHAKFGKVLLVFTPDERTVEALKKYIPVKILNKETF